MHKIIKHNQLNKLKLMMQNDRKTWLHIGFEPRTPKLCTLPT